MSSNNPSPKLIQTLSRVYLSSGGNICSPSVVQSLSRPGYPICVKTLSRELKTWILSGQSLDNNTFYWINVGPGLDKPWTWIWIGLTLDKHWIKIGLSLDWISNICPTNHRTGVPKFPNNFVICPNYLNIGQNLDKEMSNLCPIFVQQ